MKKTETLNLRVSAEFKKRLTEKAERQRRSITNYLESVLIELWEREGASENKPHKGKKMV